MNPSFHENYYRLNHENNFHENNCPPSGLGRAVCSCACSLLDLEFGVGSIIIYFVLFVAAEVGTFFWHRRKLET